MKTFILYGILLFAGNISAQTTSQLLYKAQLEAETIRLYNNACTSKMSDLDELYGYMRDNESFFIPYDYEKITKEIDYLYEAYKNAMKNTNISDADISYLVELNGKFDYLFSNRSGYKKAEYNFRLYKKREKEVEPSVAKWLLDVYASKKGYLGDFQFKN